LRQRLSAIIGLVLLTQSAGSAVSAPAPKGALAPLASPKIVLVPFAESPFPYRGQIPDKNIPFMDVMEGDRAGHTSPRGGIYWEDKTYSDRRSLLFIPRGFDPNRPALIVVFFHGNEETLTRDVRSRQQVPRQLAESGLNAVLVAPQFAVNALDSSAGQFWEPGVFARYLDEAAQHLTALYGNERVRGTFANAPVVIAAYSGGYHPASFTLLHGKIDERLRGVILLDALFGDLDRFADWLARRPPAFFVSAHGKAAREDTAAFQTMLTERSIVFQKELPSSLARGTVTFIAAHDDVKHSDFMTDAWVKDPLKVLLRRIGGFPRTGNLATDATPKGK
jgi:hypothetical protein